MNQLKLKHMLETFLLEDLGDGDLTSVAIFPVEQKGRGVFLAKEVGVISGLEVIEAVYHLLDPKMEIIRHFADGETVTPGDVVAEVFGPVRYILTGERLV